MSDSSLSDGAPSTAVLEQALRNAVREVYRSGDLDNLTIKRIRKSVETEFDLQDDFFKNDPLWKEESKNIIQSEVDTQADANANGAKPSSKSSPGPPPKRKNAQPNLPKPQKPNRDIRGKKRPSSEQVKPNKRRRRESSDTEGSASVEKDVPKKKPVAKETKGGSSKKAGGKERQQMESSESYHSDGGEEEVSNEEPVPKLRKNDDTHSEPRDISVSLGSKSRKTEASESEVSDVFDEAPKTKPRKRKSDSKEPKAKANGTKAEASEEEMSEVLDEAPKVKSRKRKLDAGKPRAKKTDNLNLKKSSEQSTDPDADEIKRLQGWLIKCGIRKMWHKELAPYDNSKSKIRHLKDLLAGAGMTGRYSIEKANQIKEERELQADLEAVQEGAKQWGKSESEGEDEVPGRPKRRLAKGLQELSFLDDDDGEETD